MVDENKTPANETQDTSTETEAPATETEATETTTEEQVAEEKVDKAKYDEAVRKITELSDRSARQDRLLEVAMKEIKRQPEKEVSEPKVDEIDEILEGLDEAKFVSNPKEALKDVLKKVSQVSEARTEKRLINQYNQVVTSQSQQGEIRQKFYKENADLKGQEVLVQAYATQVGMEMPEASLEEATKEIATRARKHIASIRAGKHVETPTPVEGAGGAGVTKGKKEPTEATAKDLIEDYFKEQQKFRNKGKEPVIY